MAVIGFGERGSEETGAACQPQARGCGGGYSAGRFREPSAPEGRVRACAPMGQPPKNAGEEVDVPDPMGKASLHGNQEVIICFRILQIRIGGFIENLFINVIPFN